jgi:hypothetical protein
MENNKGKGGDGAMDILSMFLKMGWGGKLSTLAMIFWGIPAAAAFFWNATVSHAEFNPEEFRLRDGSSVGWSVGAIVSGMLRGADPEIRPLIAPSSDVPVGARRDAAKADQVFGPAAPTQPKAE